MAMSLDQGGVAFTPAVPKDESQASALASIKPLSFHPTASPIQFQPLAGWATPSTHPELLFQGITGGISAIGQGITAAYKSKSDQAREDQLLAQKYAEEEKVAKIRGDTSLELLKERLDAAGGNIGKSKEAPLQSLDSEVPSRTNDATPSDEPLPDLEKYKQKEGATNPFGDINLPDQMPQQDDKIQINSNPLANLTAPSPASELQGSSALAALSSIPWGSVSSTYKSAGGVPSQAFQPTAPDWLRNTSGVTSQINKFGQTPNMGTDKGRKDLLDALSKGYSFETGTSVPALAEKNAKMEAAIGEDAVYSQDDARKLRDYAVSHGKMAPSIIEQRNGSFLVKWPTPEQLAVEGTRKERLDIASSNAMERRANDYITKNIGPKKIEAGRAALAGFLAAYKTGLTSGNQNITDLDLADNYIAFARGASSPTGSGGQVTEGQYEELKKNGSLYNKLTKAITSRSSGAFLSPDDRKTMLNTLVEAYNSQAKRENGKLDAFRNAMLKDYPNIPKEKIPRDYPLLKTPEETRKEQIEAADEVRKIAKKLTPQERANHPEYKEALAKLSQLSSSGEIPPNADEVNNTTAGVQAGLFGGTAPINYIPQPTQ